MQWLSGAGARCPWGNGQGQAGVSEERRERLGGRGGERPRQGSPQLPAGPGSGAPVGSGGRPGVSLGSSIAEVLAADLEPRTGLVRAGRPGLGKRRSGWISWGQRAPSQRVSRGTGHTPTRPAPWASCATHVAEQLVGQAQVVVKRQEGDPLQPHHDDLRRREQGAALRGVATMDGVKDQRVSPVKVETKQLRG